MTIAAAPAARPQTAFVTFTASTDEGPITNLLLVCHELAGNGIEELTLLVSSAGGSVPHAMLAYNALRALPLKLTAYNIGHVESAASVLFLAADERYAAPTATFMFHGLTFVFGAEAVTPARLREVLHLLEVEQARVDAVLLERTAVTTEDVARFSSAESRHDASFALERRIVHGIQVPNIPQGAPIYHVAPSNR